MAKADTRDQIIAAAIKVFAARGYFQATTDDIASEAGVGKGSLYFHFGSKEELFLNLIDQMADKLWQALEEPLALDVEDREKLGRIIGAVVRVFAKHHQLARITLIEASVAGGAARRKQRQVTSRFTQAIALNLAHLHQQGVLPARPFELLATAFYGSVQEVVVRWLEGDLDLSLDDVVRELARFNAEAIGL